MQTTFGAGRALSVLMGLGLLACVSVAQAQAPAMSVERLPGDRRKSGATTLRAFETIQRAARNSVVKIDVDGNTVALGAVVDARGWVLTKASEIHKGRLTCWLASGREVGAELLTQDEGSDVALLKVAANGLQPVTWASAPAEVGQWVVTPGVAETPQAVGVVSVAVRRILHPRALLGVELNREQRGPGARIRAVMDGLGAMEAGLKSGDAIMQLNGIVVGEADELIKKLREYREGQSVNLRVKRAESEFDVAVTLKVPKPENGARGFDRSDRMNRMGSALSERAEGFALALQHDSVLQNWQCGGPLLNLEGKAVGLNIARAGRVASYALPASLVKPILDRLRVQAQNSAGTQTTASDKASQ